MVQAVSVERRLVAVDLGDPRDALVELDEAARIEPRRAVLLLRGHRFHTITSLSYGS